MSRSEPTEPNSHMAKTSGQDARLPNLGPC